jgi:hypothetical protein
MNNVKVVFEKKEDGRYIATWETTDAAEVYKRLCDVLISKKLCGCTWVKSIKRIQRYAHVEIIVLYDNGGRDIFTIPAH